MPADFLTPNLLSPLFSGLPDVLSLPAVHERAVNSIFSTPSILGDLTGAFMGSFMGSFMGDVFGVLAPADSLAFLAASAAPGFGSYVLLIIAPMLLGLWAQFRVKSAFGRYSQVPVDSGRTGAETAQDILDAAGIRDVEVVEINGMLGDHYDPGAKRLCLSSEVYRTPSVAAVGIAAHEAGHAIQHARSYAPLGARMALVPVTMFASQMLPFVVMGGFFFHITGLIKLGIACYAILALFQLITLPVEFDASRRAKIILGEMGIVSAGPEAAGVNRVLDAAALTYVAAFIAAVGNLIHLLLVARGRDSED